MPQKKNNSKQTEVSAGQNGDKPQNAYFLSLELENVRCFGKRQRIDFSDNNGNQKRWTIILGDNGTGKTTILQVLLNFFDTIMLGNHLINLKGNYLLLNSRKLVDFSLQNFSETFTKLTLGEIRKKLILSCDSEKAFLGAIFAYGALRRAGETSISDQNGESFYETLFDETALLLNPEEWLIRTHYESLLKSEFQGKRRRKVNKVIETLTRILPDVGEIRFGEKTKNNKSEAVIEFKTPYGWVESKDLSLGYRTSMAWMVDFASRMFDLYPESENPLAEPAVVLIDEIDLHLHPKWQRELIDFLTNLFPNTQFIVTTHSPLIVQAAAARDANIVVCRREGDHVVIDQSVEAVRGWRADQILTSDLFDLPSTRDTELEKLEKQRRKILSKAKLTKADEKKVKELSAELDNLRVMENPEDDKAMDIIRRAAAHLQNGES